MVIMDTGLFTGRQPMTDAVGERFAAAIGADPPEKVDDASHFLQEDAGELIGARIAEWLDR